MKSLRDKVVVITGAGSGIGRSLALLAASEGAKLALGDIDERGLAETRGEAEKVGATVFAQKLDCGSRDAIYAFAAASRNALGDADVVVNNAGVSLSESVAEMSDADFAWLMDINFWGVVHGTRAYLPQLLRRPEASVVNISSVFGIIAVPTQSAYNASKFAVRGFTEALRQELEATNVRVTCVHPGGIRTNIVRNGRHYTGADGKKTDTASLAKQFELAARTTPDEAAAVILDAVKHDRVRALIGADAYFIDRMQRMFPESYDRITKSFVKLGERLRK